MRDDDYCLKCKDCNNHCSRNPHCCDCSHCKRGACNNKFKLRLGGLANGMQFRLQQLIGCKVKLCVQCGENDENVIGILEHVGQDYVEMKVLKKQKADDTVPEELFNEENMEELSEEKEEEFSIIDPHSNDRECRKKGRTLYLSSSIMSVEII